MTSKAELQSGLAQFTGSMAAHQFSPLTQLRCTDGVKWLAENAGCYWLLDAIASHQLNQAIQQNQRLKEMQFWKLEVEEAQAQLTCVEDADYEPAVTQDIPYTDFPLEEIRLWVSGGIILLPSEY